MRVAAEQAFAALPDEVLRDLPGLVVQRFRALDVDAQGVLDPTSGARRTALRLVGGRHGRVGARYELDEEGTPDQPSDGPVLVVVRHDDRRRLELRCWHPAMGDGHLDVVVERPDHPRTVEIRGAADVEERWPIGGRVEWTVTIAVEALFPPSGHGSPVRVEVRHPRAQVHAKAAIGAAVEGSWPVRVVVSARGRGVARPVLALAAVFRAKVQAGFETALADAARDWRRAPADLLRDLDPPTAASVVDALVADLLAGPASGPADGTGTG